jgi:DNA-directed RNA polymerase specialized sigma24 family protein
LESAPSSNRQKELTQAAFDGLLAQLDADRNAAGVKYENTRTKLVKFFERRGCPSPDDHADEVINIVARQITEGTKIENINAYFLGVAKRHVITISRGPEMDPLENPDTLPTKSLSPGSSDIDERDVQEMHLRILDHCLDEIGFQHRTLILGYYEENKQAKIDNRKALAESFGIDLNALRIRVCRIRMKLEKCINECVNHETGEAKSRREFA